MVAAGSEKLLVMKTQRLAGLGVLEADAPQKFGVILTGVEAVQGDGLVANDAGRAIRRRRIDAMSIDVRLGTRDEEGPGLVQHIKAGKVDVATIHDVDGSGFRQEHIEGMNVVQLAIRDVDKTRNVAPQVEQRVHLHRRLGGAEVHPRKDRQAQSDVSSSPGRRRCWSGPTPVSSSTYSVLAWVMSRWANAAWIRQSRLSLASASVERRTGWRKPM